MQGVNVLAHRLPFHSKGVVPRLRNVRFAAARQGIVTHITGDVHYAAAMMRRESAILTVLDCHALDRLTGWRREVFRNLWYTLPLRNVRYVTVISEETKRVLLNNCDFDESRIAVIPVSVSGSFESERKASFPGRPRVLHVGTKPNKNLERLIPALAGMSCELSIVGPLSPEQTSLLDKHQIHYTQRQRLTDDEIVQAYRDADVVAFVSTYEGFGMPIVEGQLAQRPVVTSNISSMPEVAGQGARLVDPLDIDSIRDGFREVFESEELRQRLIRNGLTNARRFDHQQICRQYLNLYQKASC